MLLRIFVVTALLVAGLALVKESSVLDRTGLVGTCRVVDGMSAGDEVWQACRPGKLQGRPNLARRSCKSKAIVGDVEYWRCEAPLENGPPA